MLRVRLSADSFGRCANAPRLNMPAAVADKFFNRADIAFYDPIIEVPHAQVVRVMNIALRGLPGIVGIGLARPGNFHVQLFDAKCMFAAEREVARATLGADPPEP